MKELETGEGILSLKVESHVENIQGKCLDLLYSR